MNLFTTAQHFVPQKTLSQLAGKIASSTNPVVKTLFTHSFAKAYNISLHEYARGHLADYHSFNDFFTRELATQARPIDATPNGIACPADGTVSQLGQIHNQQVFQAKGKHYQLSQLLADYDDAKAFENGNFLTVYLAPSNYHRVHMPLTGALKKTRYIPGKLFSVNQATAENVPDLFARNERLVCLFDTTVGEMAVILVGAMIVAGIETVATGKIEHSKNIIEQTHQLTLNKGDELGRFYLGSTAIVLLPEQAQVMWQPNIHANQTVKMGMGVGRYHIKTRSL